jgi:glycine cleavage system transcriptional repressor
MYQWFMLTLVGEDKLGIVAKITAVLYENGCHLGEASMIRLGGNFTIMLMVNYSGNAEKLSTLLEPTVQSLGLYAHVDAIKGTLHEHHSPDVRITVYGADRAGIVAQVTESLAHSGMNILNLESNVGGTAKKPFYIMHIEGSAAQGISILEAAIQNLIQQHPDLKVKLENIETFIV